MRPYDSSDDRAPMLALLEQHIDASRPGHQQLIQQWLGGTEEGLISGDPPAYAFYKVFDGKARINGLLAPDRRLPDLLTDVLPVLQGRFSVVVSEAEAWSRVFGRRLKRHDRIWNRLGFRQLAVEVLQAPLPGHREATSPPGYRLDAWLPESVPPAALLMARTPDPLQQEVATSVDECRSILQSGCDPSLGAVAWKDDRLAGFITAHPPGVIGQLYVDPEHQRRGLGTALLDHTLAQLHTVGAPHVRLTMIEGNGPAWQLYGSRGFRRVFDYPCRFWQK